MDTLIRYAACLAGALQILAMGFIVSRSYGRDVYIALLMILPPLLFLLALLSGPDLEERRLARRLNKARMKRELEKLSEKA